MLNTVLSALNGVPTPLGKHYYHLHSEDEEPESEIVKLIPNATGCVGINPQAGLPLGALRTLYGNQ